MPEHGGMMMVQFYNALFHVTSDFRGNCHGHGDVIIETLNVEPTPVFKVIIWKWTRRKGLFRMVWERMLVKARQIAQQAISLTSKLVDEPLGSIVEVPY
jgi:hypothetical protein